LVIEICLQLVLDLPLEYVYLLLGIRPFIIEVLIGEALVHNDVASLLSIDRLPPYLRFAQISLNVAFGEAIQLIHHKRFFLLDSKIIVVRLLLHGFLGEGAEVFLLAAIALISIILVEAFY